MRQAKLESVFNKLCNTIIFKTLQPRRGQADFAIIFVDPSNYPVIGVSGHIPTHKVDSYLQGSQDRILVPDTLTINIRAYYLKSIYKYFPIDNSTALTLLNKYISGKYGIDGHTIDSTYNDMFLNRELEELR